MTRHFGSPHRGDYQCDKRDSEGNARPAQGLTGDQSRLFGVHDAEPAISFGLIHSSPLGSRPALWDGGDVNRQSGALMGDALILFGCFWRSTVQLSWRSRALSQYLRLLRSATVPRKMARGDHRVFLLHRSELSALAHQRGKPRPRCRRVRTLQVHGKAVVGSRRLRSRPQTALE